MKTFLRRALYTLLALFALIQLVPYGRGEVDPPVTKEPSWDSPRTRELAVRACFDCHSRTPNRPWYSRVAPVSWLVQHDIEEGREHLDFSAWDQPQRDAHEAGETIEEGEMPPELYLPLHPEAQLSASEKDELVRGLQASLADAIRPARRGGGERRERDDD